MKPKLFLTLLFIVSVIIQDNAQTVTFEKHFGNMMSDNGFSVTSALDGGYIVAGAYMDLADFKSKGIIIKTNSFGDSIWSKLFLPVITYNTTLFRCVDQTASGYVFGGSTMPDFMTTRSYIVKTDVNGDTIWTRQFGEVQRNNSYYCVQTLSDNNYIFGGNTQTAYGGVLIPLLTKVSTSGDSLWTCIVAGGASNSYVTSVKETDDGGFIAVTVDGFLNKVDASGTLSWSKPFGIINLNSIDITSGNDLIITGTNSSQGNNSIYLIKTNPSGDTLWTRTYFSLGLGTSTTDNQGYSVQQTDDGGFIIGGSAIYQNFIPVMYLLKTNDQGDSLWAKYWGEVLTMANHARGYSVEQTADGGYVFCGLTSFPTYGMDDIYLIKTDSTGELTSNPQVYKGSEYSIYPNPFNESTTIKFYNPENSEFRMSLRNINGCTVRQSDNITGNEIKIERKGLKSGVYFVELKGEGRTYRGKVVVE